MPLALQSLVALALANMSPAPSSPLVTYRFGHHDVFDDVHDRLELRLEGQRDFDCNIPPFLLLHVKEVS